MSAAASASASAAATTFETGHQEMIHDAQFDYYGKRLATASSDRTIRIFDLGPVNGQQSQGQQQQQQQLIGTLIGHDGPIFAIQWAHPRFGCILGSVSYDGRVIIWKEVAVGRFDMIYQHAGNKQLNGITDAAATSISFAPYQCGLTFAVGRSDGTVTVYSRRDDNTFDDITFMAHLGGVNAVSYASHPYTSAAGQQPPAQPQQQQQLSRYDARFVTGGCDNKIRVWRYDATVNNFVEHGQFASVNANDTSASSNVQQHHDWVRDVAWSPSMGLPSNVIASASEDRTVVIWNEDQQTGVWQRGKVIEFNDKVWRVSWSVMGNVLAVAQGDNRVSLWKETVDGEWIQISGASESGINQQANDSLPSSTATANASSLPSQTSVSYSQPQQQQQQPTQQQQQQGRTGQIVQQI